MARRYRQKQSIGWKIVVAILAFIGLLFIIDKAAGTNMLQSLWNAFVNMLHEFEKFIGGIK